MPSHKIHIKIAQEINKKLKLDDDSIMLGSVLPDLTIEKEHGLSHFQYADVYPQNLANADEFLKKYSSFADDISIGYIIHLLTDKYYNDIYYQTFTKKGIKLCKEYKHSLFESFDKFLLKHKLVNKFKNYDVINKMPNYKDLSFDKKILEKYITDFNKEIDEETTDNNYTIDNIEFLSSLYNECIKYVIDYLNKNVRK